MAVDRSTSSAKVRAWELFDEIVTEAAPGGVHTNPWVVDGGVRVYSPDFAILTALLGVPLHLRAKTQSGVPALALDVWLSYELRRAGFDRDAVWPRPEHPRVLPAAVVNLLRELPRKEAEAIADRIARTGALRGVTASSASILGKNYLKQVDVIMTDWATGPELLISTKRMDSSYGKNAANRIEESYGDAKNLRLRHPLAALGFVFGLRSDILQKEPDTAEWLIDLLGKLGREEDAYHATCLVMIEYDDALAAPDDGEDPEDRSAAAGLAPSEPVVPGGDVLRAELPSVAEREIERVLARLPRVTIRHEAIPDVLSPVRFLAMMVDHVLDTTPVNFHKEARRRRREASPG